ITLTAKNDIFTRLKKHNYRTQLRLQLQPSQMRPLLPATSTRHQASGYCPNRGSAVASGLKIRQSQNNSKHDCLVSLSIDCRRDNHSQPQPADFETMQTTPRQPQKDYIQQPPTPRQRSTPLSVGAGKFNHQSGRLTHTWTISPQSLASSTDDDSDEFSAQIPASIGRVAAAVRYFNTFTTRGSSPVGSTRTSSSFRTSLAQSRPVAENINATPPSMPIEPPSISPPPRSPPSPRPTFRELVAKFESISRAENATMKSDNSPSSLDNATVPTTCPPQIPSSVPEEQQTAEPLFTQIVVSTLLCVCLLLAIAVNFCFGAMDFWHQ
ncbi:hypothetical protein BOX15_Mlig012406g3, partial [Macrostomum lignano]